MGREGFGFSATSLRMREDGMLGVLPESATDAVMHFRSSPPSSPSCCDRCLAFTLHLRRLTTQASLLCGRVENCPGSASPGRRKGRAPRGLVKIGSPFFCARTCGESHKGPLQDQGRGAASPSRCRRASSTAPGTRQSSGGPIECTQQTYWDCAN